MKTIKEVRNIEVLVNITYSIENNELKQVFHFNVFSKKHLDYLFDARFLFKNKIEKLIKKNLLNDYIRRVDDKDTVEIYYKSQEVPKPAIRKISSIIPPFLGCEFCEKAEKKEGFIYCKEKDKHYTKNGIQRCPIFKCADIEIT